MKVTNAAIILVTSLILTSDHFADAAQQLRGHRGGVETEAVLGAFMNTDITNTGDIDSISKVEDLAHPALSETTNKSPNQNQEAAVLALDVVPPNLRRATLNCWLDGHLICA